MRLGEAAWHMDAIIPQLPRKRSDQASRLIPPPSNFNRSPSTITCDCLHSSTSVYTSLCTMQHVESLEYDIVPSSYNGPCFFDNDPLHGAIFVIVSPSSHSSLATSSRWQVRPSHAFSIWTKDHAPHLRLVFLALNSIVGFLPHIFKSSLSSRSTTDKSIESANTTSIRFCLTTFALSKDSSPQTPLRPNTTPTINKNHLAGS